MTRVMIRNFLRRQLKDGVSSWTSGPRDDSKEQEDKKKEGLMIVGGATYDL